MSHLWFACFSNLYGERSPHNRQNLTQRKLSIALKGRGGPQTNDWFWTLRRKTRWHYWVIQKQKSDSNKTDIKCHDLFWTWCLYNCPTCWVGQWSFNTPQSTFYSKDLRALRLWEPALILKSLDSSWWRSTRDAFAETSENSPGSYRCDWSQPVRPAQVPQAQEATQLFFDADGLGSPCAVRDEQMDHRSCHVPHKAIEWRKNSNIDVQNHVRYIPKEKKQITDVLAGPSWRKKAT